MAIKERFTVNIDANQFGCLRWLAEWHGVPLVWHSQRAIARILAEHRLQCELLFFHVNVAQRQQDRFA